MSTTMTTTYSCLAIPLSNDNTTKNVKLQTSKRIQLKCFYRHTNKCTNTFLDDSAVLLLFKVFSKTEVKMQTAFRARMSSREFNDLMSKDDMVVDRSNIEEVEGVLRVYSYDANAYVDNRTLVTSQLKIFSALNTSYVMCKSDMVRWYVTTATRLVVGDEYEMMGYPYSSVLPFMTQYYIQMKSTGAKSVASDLLKRHNIISTEISSSSRFDTSSTYDILGAYKYLFGGDKICQYIDMSSEVLSAACVALKRFTEIYESYNLVSRDVMTCDSMSYGLLQYFESMHKRFPSVASIMLSTQETEEESMAHVEEYKRSLKDVSDLGSTNIVKHIRQTVMCRPYDALRDASYEFDTFLPHSSKTGMTAVMSCDEICKDVLSTDMFPCSLSKRIKGVSVVNLSNLCNSDRTLLVTNEKVKSLLRDRHGVPINVPFVAVEMANGYKFSRIADPMKLCNAFGKPQALQLVTKYLESPSMQSFTKYAKKFADMCPKLSLHDIIVPHMPIYSLCINVDRAELVRTFYDLEKTDAWPVRQAVITSVTDAMEDFLKVVDQDGMLGENRRQFVLYAFESIPDCVPVKKVGLRFIFKFKYLVFLDNTVAYNFVVAFKFFLARTTPAVAYAMDLDMIKKGGLLRTPMSYKIKNQCHVRQLMPLFVSKARVFDIAQTLFHTRHDFLSTAGDVVILTSIGDVTSLIRTPEQEEFNLRKRRFRKTEAPLSNHIFSQQGPTVLVDNYVNYFKSIILTDIMPAIWNTGGGFKDQYNVLTDVRKRVGVDCTEYFFYPTIMWCTSRHHANPRGNPCSYFIKTNPTQGTYSLWGYCFACKVHRDILIGEIPLRVRDQQKRANTYEKRWIVENDEDEEDF